MPSVMQTLFLRGAVSVCRFPGGRIHLYKARAQKAGGREKSHVLTEGWFCGQLGREEGGTGSPRSRLCVFSGLTLPSSGEKLQLPRAPSALHPLEESPFRIKIETHSESW